MNKYIFSHKNRSRKRLKIYETINQRFEHLNITILPPQIGQVHNSTKNSVTIILFKLFFG